MLFSLICLLPAANAVYLVIRSGQSRCFTESVPKDSVLKVTYSSLTPEVKLACTLNAKGPKGQIAIADTPLSYTSEATAVLHAKDQGSYSICLQCPRSSPDISTKWTLRFDHVGDLAMMDFAEDSATKDNVTSTAAKLRELIARAIDQSREMQDERREDDELRKKAEGTTNLVLAANIVQVVVIVLMNQLSAYSIGKFIRQAQMV